MGTKYNHKVEIVHENGNGSFEYVFTADEETSPNVIFQGLVRNLSIIVHDVEEIETEQCDGCAEEFEEMDLTEDENSGVKFCWACQEENQNN